MGKGIIRILLVYLFSVWFLVVGTLFAGELPISTSTPAQITTPNPSIMVPVIENKLLLTYAMYSQFAYLSPQINPPAVPGPTPTPVLSTLVPIATPTPTPAVQVDNQPPAKVVGHEKFGSGLSVTVFERPVSTGGVEYAVAFRGTEPADLRDVITAAQQPLWIQEQYTNALSYAGKWVTQADQKNVPVTFVGHSLGGALAEYAGLEFGRNTVCFNAAALGSKTILSLEGKEVANASFIHHVVRVGDPAFFLTQLIPGSAHFGSVQLMNPNSDILGRLDTILKVHSIDTMVASLLNGELPTDSMTVQEANRLWKSVLQKNASQLLAVVEQVLEVGMSGRILESVVLESAEKLRIPESEHKGHHHPPNGGEGGEAVVAGLSTQSDDRKSSDAAKGVRIHFDERILAEVLAKGTTDDNAKLIDELIHRLAAVQSEPEKKQILADFEEQVKRRFLELREVHLLHDLTAVSLKSLVARAEVYKSDWGNLPDDLRWPASITRIHGFAIIGDDILMIGKLEPGAPILGIDDLIVGVQSVWKENVTPVVSLDPDPANIEGDPNVRIQGVADDSEFALTMLEADYAMKKIMAGVDPIDVPGYRTLKETLSETDRTFMSRFWLYPVQPRVGDIRVSSDTSSSVFIGAVRVLSEEMLNLKEGLVGTGQTFLPAEEAADSFTTSYDAIAIKRPIFKRLQLLFDVVLMARIWHVRGLQSSLLDRLCALPHRAVKIPRTYRAIRVFLRRDAKGEYYIQGGVQAKIGAGRRTWLDLDDQGLDSLRQYCQRISDAGDVSKTLSDLSLNAVAPLIRPDTSSRDFTSAVTNLFRGDLKAALAAADRLVAYDNFDSEALVLRALIQMRRMDYVQARADARKAREIDPGDREAAAAAGQILFQCAWMQGDPESALREMDDSIKDDLQRANGQVSRGEALVLLDRPDEAKKAFLKALELDPACATACARLAQMELAQGRTLAAKPWVQKALALDANLPAVRIASAQWELVTVRPDLAEKIASEVWEKQTSGPTARLQALAILAAVSASREKWNNVDKYVALMDELSASSPEVLVAAAEIAMQWGERERASTYLEKAVKLSPRHPLVLKMLARLAR
jgi:tetratricopeptide (TPR) repeat protein